MLTIRIWLVRLLVWALSAEPRILNSNSLEVQIPLAGSSDDYWRFRYRNLSDSTLECCICGDPVGPKGVHECVPREIIEGLIEQMDDGEDAHDLTI